MTSSLKKLFVFILLLSFLSTPAGVVLAETGTSPAVLRDQLKTQRQDVMVKKQEIRSEVKTKMEAARASFKEKLAAIRDTKKQAIVERVDNKISTMNTNQTARMTGVLEKLTNALTRISEQASILKNDGKNTVTLDAAIVSAQTALNTAKSAVEAQAAKDYTPTITTEAVLRTTVGTMFSEFRTDMTATHKTVVDARAAVRLAATEFAKLKNTSGSNAATGAATLTP